MALSDWWRNDAHVGLDPDRRRRQAAMARVMALLWLAGGSLALLILAFPLPEGLSVPTYVTIGVGSLLIGAAVWLAGPRLPILALEALCALGIVSISLSLAHGGDQLSSVSENELIYLWLVLYAGYFFGRRALLALLFVLAVSYGLVIASVDAGENAATRWLVVTAALSIMALFVAHLRTRIDYELSLHQATLESTTDGLLVVDANGNWESFNRNFLEMWRIPAEITEARNDDAALAFVLDQLDDPAAFLSKVRELYEEPQGESYEVLRFKDGRVFERYSKPQLIEGRVVGRVWSFRDVTDKHRADERLKHLADHDPLTDLFNRRRFEEELGRELARSTRYGRGGALLLLDLDDFKGVNDTYGHLWGDEVLRATARLLGSRLRNTDVLSRLGGDEFAVLLPEADEVRAVKLAEELLEVLRAHGFETDRGPLAMTTSIGVVTLPMPEGGELEPMTAADTAMYRAKRDGRDRLAVFDPTEDSPDSRGEGKGGLRRGT